MTVRYAGEYATNSKLGCFTRLLFRWRGSVYKFVWKEYLVFLALFFSISFVYRVLLTEDEQKFFEKIANFCERSKEAFRLYFVLGFFVTSIVSKWWKMYDIIPYPDGIAHYVYASIRGQDEATKSLRKSIVRQCCLSLTLTFLAISPSLKRRYPTFDHLIREGMLTEEEKVKLEKMDKKTNHCILWYPITLATDLVVKASNEGNIHHSACSRIYDQMDKLRQGCSQLLEYERNSVPLAYVQVVTISVYTYFFSCLFGRQWLVRDEKLKDLDLFFPFVTTLEFIFYMGWLKVAETMINPFGSDDDDFEIEDMVHRNYQVTCDMAIGADEDEDDSGDKTDHNNIQNSAVVPHFFNNDTFIDCNKLEATAISPPPEFYEIMAVAEAEDSANDMNLTDKTLI